MKGIDNPSFLSLDPLRGRLYAVAEMFEWKEGLVFAYAVDLRDGTLHYLNMQPTLGSLPCYVALDQTACYVVVSNYWSGNVSIFPLNEDGSLGSASDMVQHVGSGPSRQRQAGPHAHCAVIDPTNRFLFVCDLGLDEIKSYRLDIEHGKLLRANPPGLQLDPGCGPRHMVFHPSTRFAYVINELRPTIDVLGYDSKTGVFQRLQTISTLPKRFSGQSAGADIQVHPSGQFLYGSNRGCDTIASYTINEATRLVSLIAHQSTLGKRPRNFAIDPTGEFLIVANQDSDTVIPFRIDRKTGGLDATGHAVDVGTPACIKFWRNL
jgi:6-phosphogluconolactonase